MDLKLLSIIIQSDVPVVIEDDPGTGKTKLVQALSRTLKSPSGQDYQFHEEVLSRCDPTDLGGWPREDGDVIIRKPLDWIMRAATFPSIIFFDEMSLAQRASLAAALRLISEREAAGCKLHPETRIVSAMNGTAFTGVDLLPQVANRFAHLKFTDMVPLADWCQGMMSGFPDPIVAMLPDTWETGIPKARAIVAAFASKCPSEAFRTPKNAAEWGKAWPSRRTWDYAARVSAACESVGEDDAAAIASLVGTGPAMAFVAWRNDQDLPDAAAVLADPLKHVLPEDDTKLFVIASACAALAVAKPAPKLWASAWIVLKRLCDMKRQDVAVVAGRVLANNMPAGATVPKEAAALLPMLQLTLGGKR